LVSRSRQSLSDFFTIVCFFLMYFSMFNVRCLTRAVCVGVRFDLGWISK
jgi:hypothetical protein